MLMLAIIDIFENILLSTDDSYNYLLVEILLKYYVLQAGLSLKDLLADDNRKKCLMYKSYSAVKILRVEFCRFSCRVSCS